MIVRNEAAGIEKTLECFAPYIDYWTIADTGSDDDTGGIILRKMRALNRQGRLVYQPWSDFATNRNELLDAHGERTEFTLMIDADDHLEGGDALRAQLEALREAPAAMIKRQGSPQSFYLPLVLRTSAKLRYTGKVHERIDGIVNPYTLTDTHLVQVQSSTSVEARRARWLRDLELLKSEDPHDPRATFYLAQTHECLGELGAARSAYARRSCMTGYFDETFEAKLRYARLMHEDDWAEAQDELLRAHALDPRRAEPLYEIAAHWHKTDQHALTWLFASRAADLPRPALTGFVDESVYAWKAADLAAISGYYLSQQGHAVAWLAWAYAERALTHGPSSEKDRLTKNVAFCRKLLGLKR